MEPTYLVFLIIAASLTTYLWRGLGVLIAARLNPDGVFFEWISCVAYAMLAGLMARVLILPVGLLGETTMFVRGISMLAGFIVFFALKRNFYAATLVSILTFLMLQYSDLGSGL